MSPLMSRCRFLVGVGMLAAAVVFTPGCASQTQCTLCNQLQPASEELKPIALRRLGRLRKQMHAPGATAAFVLHGRQLLAVAGGDSDNGAKIAMQPHDRMLAGSVGKTYVAAVALQLLEEGRLALDTKISHWLGDEPWFARLPNAADITLYHLMTHTSGIPEHVMMPEFLATVAADPDREWRPEELVAFVLDKEPLFPTGKGWSYADTNYILVGMIIERVTGTTYYEQAKRRLLVPLELHDTIPSDRQTLPGLIPGYTSHNSPFPVRTQVSRGGRVDFNPQMEWTGGGMLSTSPDLARWAYELYAGKVLKPETRKLMLAGVEAGPRLGSPDHKYGLGAIIRNSAHGPVYGHSGWFPGYITVIAYYPELDIAAAVQFNASIQPAPPAIDAYLDQVVGLLAERLSE